MSTKKYTELDPRNELEQQVTKDLTAALKKREAKVVHHGKAASHAPASAPADITVDWSEKTKKCKLLVEVAQRTNESEFTPIVAHLDAAVAATRGTNVNVIYAGRSTSARLARFIRNENMRRQSNSIAGRIIYVKLNDLQVLLARWSSHPKEVYPLTGLLAAIGRWKDFTSDINALQILCNSLFPDWSEKATEVSAEMLRLVGVRQERLRKDIIKLENKLHERGITGQRAHKILIFIFFAALYEDKKGPSSRATREGFLAYRASIPASAKNSDDYRERTLHHLLVNEIGEDPEIKGSGMMSHYEKVDLPDDFVITMVLPIFEAYPLSDSGMDFIGAVFEALARGAEKDHRIGQFFTPETAVAATIKMISPRPTDVVLDPACGTGRFLIQSMGFMLARAGEVTSKPIKTVEEGIRKQQLLGTDIDPWIATIAKMNMYLHGDGKSSVQAGNGLSLASCDVFPGHNPPKLDKNVDDVATNPPLGDIDFRETANDLARNGFLGAIDAAPGTPAYTQEVERLAGIWTNARLRVVPHKCIEQEKKREHEAAVAKWDQKVIDAATAKDDKAIAKAKKYRAAAAAKLAEVNHAIGAGNLTYAPSGKTAKGGALFLSAILDYLKQVRDPNLSEEWKGGVVGIVVDEAILNTAEYKAAREFIVANYFIKAVVSLPREAFQFLARTTAKTSILILTKKPDPSVQQREPVFYAKADIIGYTSSGACQTNDLESIVPAYLSWKGQIAGCYKAGVLDTKAAHKLGRSIPEYAKRVFFYDLDPAKPAERLDFAYRRMREIVAGLKSATRLSSLLTPVVRIPDEKETYPYAYVRSEDGRVRSKGEQDLDYAPRDLREIRTNDILLSGIDVVRGAVGVVGSDCSGMVVSKEFFTLRIQKAVAGKVLPEYLTCLLRSKPVQEIIEGSITGVSNRTRIETIEDFLDLQIPSPAPISKQKAIVSQLRKAYQSQDKAHESLQQIENDVVDV
jgi:type I restriction-modification system DNA methylase subunit